MKFPLLTIVPCVLALGLAAQEPSRTLGMIPKDALLLVQFDGPRKLADVFGATDAGKFLTSDVVTEALAPFAELFEADSDEVDASPEQQAARDAFAAFGGRITVAFDVEADSRSEDPILRFAVVLTPGDGDDIGALQSAFTNDIENRLEAEQIDGRERPFGDLTLRIFDVPTGATTATISLPVRVDDELVLFGWSGADDAIDAWATLAPDRQSTAADFATASFELRIQPARVIEAALATADQSFLDIEGIFSALGLTGLGTIELAARPIGKHVAIDFGVTWSDRGGILDAFVPEQGGTPRLLELTPKHVEAWSIGAFRPGVLYDALAAVWDTLDGIVPMSREDGEAAFADAMKVRLREDLLDHFGGEMMNVADASTLADDDVDDPLYAMSAQSFAFELRDAKAFAASFETLIRARGLQAARKTTDYRGIDVRRVKLAGLVTLDYAITDRLFVVAINSGELTHLHAILDEELARRAGEPAAPLPADVATRLAALGEGWNGISVTDTATVLQAMRAGIEAEFEDPTLVDAEFDVGALLDGLGRMQAEMKARGLQRMVSATWSKPGSIRAHVIW